MDVLGTHLELNEIYYFSALAFHRDKNDPLTTARHQRYIDCLTDTGIKIVMSKFKKKPYSNRHEEKETDVAIACKLLELFYLDKADSIAIVSGDSDLTPPIRTAFELFPSKSVYAVFPFGRKSKESAKLVKFSFKLKADRYVNNQFANPYTLKSGREIEKPDTW